MPGACLVAIPTYGRHDLTTRLLAQLAERPAAPPRAVETDVVVVDNRGDFAAPHGIEVVRPPRNLQWIGSANYAFERAAAGGYAACAVLNNDIEISDALVAWLMLALDDIDTAAVVSPFYDCYWPHQWKPLPAGGVRGFAPTRAYREVPFCDGTALLVSVEAVREVGLLDVEVFPWHGYGADVDYGIRARRHGMRSIATEGCYVVHQRRATIGAHVEDVERRIADAYRGGLERKWGLGWPELAGIRGPLLDPVHDAEREPVALGAQFGSP